MTDCLIPLRGVVTGASSGIGRAIAVQLASEFGNRGRPDFDRIVVHYRTNLDGANETIRMIEAIGVSTKLVQADICDASDRNRLIEASFDFLERPTTWVNNAGADVLTGDERRLDFTAKLRLLLETDLIGTIALTRRLIERLGLFADATAAIDGSESDTSLTFIGWDQAPMGMEGDAGQLFGPVKAAVMAYANSLAQELAPRIRVNTIAPGWIKTAWGEQTDSYWDRRAREQALMNRWGTPEDVAAAVCFVADPSNTFCSGQTIAVNGGWSRRFLRNPDE